MPEALPAAASPRQLIVSADDFGQSAGINDAIIRCHEEGVVTSASLMVRWPHAASAAAYARRQSILSVGLHVDLGEWVWRDGSWVALYEVVPADNPPAIRNEVRRQLDTFRQLTGRDPTHIDSHQHVHDREPARSAVLEISRQLTVPCRRSDDRIRYCGEFYGQTATGEELRSVIEVWHLIRVVETLSEGITEIACHPGLRGDAPGMYVVEREREVQVLCDPRVRRTIQDHGIGLISFAHVGTMRRL